jgi:chemotaxis response regulator CheB
VGVKIRIALVEDNPRISRALQERIAGAEGVELLFAAANGKDALLQISASLPDVILMDIKCR